MSKKHNWLKDKAETAVADFNLRKTHKDKISKCKYKRKICKICIRPRSFARIRNHLRQFHGLSSFEAKKAEKKCPIVIENDSDKSDDADSSSAESSDSDEEKVREKQLLEHTIANELHNTNATIFQSLDSETSDDDWLGKQYDLLSSKRIDNKVPEDSETDYYSSEENIEVEKDLLEATVPKEKVNEEQLSEEQLSEEQLEHFVSEEESATERDNEDIMDGFIFSTNEEDVFLKEFREFLCSIDGGDMPERTASKHARTLQLVLRYQCETNNDFTLLCDRGFLNKWMTFASQTLPSGKRKMEAGTIRTYLGSIQHLHRFIEISGKEQFNMKKIKYLESIIKGWKRSLWKELERRKHHKNLLDMKNFPTAEQIRSMDESAVGKEAIQLLNEYSLSSDPKVTRKGLCLIRDFLLTNLLFDNATRPGALSNMTLEEFRDAEHQKDGVVVSVKKHKTDYKGPAFVSFGHSLYRYTNDYVENVRNKLPGIGTKNKDAVFVSFSGLSMTSNMITMQMNSMWKRIFGKTGGNEQDLARITPTIIRKFTETSVLSDHKEFSQDAANHLCHSQETAKKCYYIVDKKRKAAETSQKIKNIQRNTLDVKFEKKANNEDIERYFMDEIKSGQIKKAIVDQKIDEIEHLAHFKDTKGRKRVLDVVRYAISKRLKGIDMYFNVHYRPL